MHADRLNKVHILVHISSIIKYKKVIYVIRLVLYYFRKDLIHEDIENAVAHMQSVIELGRVVRDRKTLPIKV